MDIKQQKLNLQFICKFRLAFSVIVLAMMRDPFVSMPALLLYIAVLAALVCSTLATNRDQIITNAIQEVQLSEFITEAQSQEDEGSPKSSSQLLRAFKRPSQEAVRMGKAQVRFEKMLRIAEKRIVEAQKVNEDELAKMESTATLMMRPPGTVLSQPEVARIAQEAGCEEPTIPDCNSPSNKNFRTSTGVCNNLNNPLLGSARTPFRRLIPPQYEDGFNQLRGTMQSQDTYSYFFKEGPYQPPNPSARVISTAVIENKPVTESDSKHSHLLMQWGQFIDHDVDLAPAFTDGCKGCTLDEQCVPIRVPENDATFGVAGQTNLCHQFQRSIPVCDSEAHNGVVRPREQLNEINSFLDGSQVYGSNDKVFNAVREQGSGLLRTGPSIPASGKASLPIDKDKLVECMGGNGCFLAGDVRVNEQPGLLIMHTVWMREHNRVATALKAENPHWNGEQIFQTARAIVGAEIQKITFKDYLPILLGDAMSLIEAYSGYKDDINPSVANGFATAAFRFGHSQINKAFDRLNSKYKSLSIGPLNLLDAFFDPSQFEKSGGTDPILRGMLSTPCRKVDEFLNNVLTNHLFQISGSTHGMDLASLNIQRGRDHGLPPYLTWRRWAEKECKMSGFFANDATHLHLLKTYGTLETVDLWVGGLAEKRVSGGLVGPTFACIFARTFQALRDGDRFYYENPDSPIFNEQQRKEIEKASLSRIICDNSDGITTIQPNAFSVTQSRQSCSSDSIPQVDVSTWTQNSANECFIKVAVQAYSASIKATSDPGSSTTVTTKFGDTSKCISFSCPSDFQNTVKVTLSATSQGSFPSPCQITPHNFGLSRNPYTISVENGKLDPENGIYDSLDSCTRGRRSNAGIYCGGFAVANNVEENDTQKKFLKLLLKLLE